MKCWKICWLEELFSRFHVCFVGEKNLLLNKMCNLRRMSKPLAKRVSQLPESLIYHIPRSSMCFRWSEFQTKKTQKRFPKWESDADLSWCRVRNNSSTKHIQQKNTRETLLHSNNIMDFIHPKTQGFQASQKTYLKKITALDSKPQGSHLPFKKTPPPAPPCPSSCEVVNRLASSWQTWGQFWWFGL